ncbi:MAG: hypothetical protein HQK96_17840 [Nitrospirae bacterium]|nr:hypothetical protein [Nitrospirota bacterium]
MFNKYFKSEYNYFDEDKNDVESISVTDERVKEEYLKFESEYYQTERAIRRTIGYVNKQD